MCRYDVDVATVLVNGTKTPQDAIQMAVLGKWAGVPAPKIYFVAGPTRVFTAAPSEPFTLTYRGYIDRAITISCEVAAAAGGAHRAGVLTKVCPAGYNCDAQFAVTVHTSEPYAVSCSNNGGLVDPPGLSVTSSTDMFEGAAAAAANVFSLRRLYPGYDGPLVRLRRSVDNSTMNFTTTTTGIGGNLDTATIQKWCAGACLTYVDTWFDQSPNRWHAGNVTSDFKGGGNRNVSIADQPQLVVADGSESLGSTVASSHIHFDGTRRMDAKSPIDGLPGQTLLAVMSTNATARASKS